MRRRARRDVNHAQIRDGLRECGRPVKDLGSCPGALDLLTMHIDGHLIWLEVKPPGEADRLTDTEIATLDEFDCPYIFVIETLDEAFKAVGLMDEEDT